MSTTITIFVPGVPAPGGSKTASVIRRKGGAIVTRANGSPMVIVRDAGGKKNASWKEACKVFGCQAYKGPPLDGPLQATVVFAMPRPKHHFRTGKRAGELLDTAPRWHTAKPDATKLWRSTEDALTGIFWTDDAQIVKQEISKRYMSAGERPGASIQLTRLEVRS